LYFKLLSQCDAPKIVSQAEICICCFAGFGPVFVLQLAAGVRATPPGPAAAAATTAAAPVVGAVPTAPSANHNAAKTVNESAALPTL
jgi:hypothetical protein